MMAGAVALATMMVGVTQAQADTITITHGSTTINMAFVPVGNAGNTADPLTGYGAVGYNYSIGTYDVTADQWAAVIAADSNVGTAGYWSGSQPVAEVSWNEAAMFCNWLTTGNADSGYYTINGSVVTPNALSHNAYAALYGTTYFIPTDNEWYKAAYYNGNTGIYYTYPTGSNTVPTAVTGGTAPGTAVFGGIGVNGIVVQPSAPANVDNAGGLSPYGTMGQGGNVWQWNETPGWFQHMRGGWFLSYPDDLLSSSIYDYNPADAFENVGFRVASVAGVPEPGSITMLIAGAIVGLICWRRWR